MFQINVVVWREINQQDATNPMFIIKLLSQHVSGIIMPIIRRKKLCTTAYGVLHCNRGGGGNYVRNMLRWKCDNKHQTGCILLVSLSSLHLHDARSQEPKKRLQWKSNTRCKFNDSFLQKNHAANEITWEIWHSRTDQRWRYTKHALCMLDN